MIVFDPMSKENPVSRLDELLAGVPDCFLSGEEPCEVNDPKVQKILGKIWDLTTFICQPHTLFGLNIPTSFLLEQELVSPVVANEISSLPNLDERINKVMIRKNTDESSILLSKTHIASEVGQVGSWRVRGDTLVEETMSLTKDGSGIFMVKETSKEEETHFHVDGQRYVLSPDSKKNTQPKDEVITSRKLNRWLACIIQGLKPGYFDQT